MAAAEAGWRRPGCKDVLVSVVQVSPWLFDLVLFENAIVVAWTYREAGGGGGGRQHARGSHRAGRASNSQYTWLSAVRIVRHIAALPSNSSSNGRSIGVALLTGRCWPRFVPGRHHAES